MMFLSMLNVKLLSFISLSDAKVRDLSARVYSTKPSLSHAFTDVLRHAKIFSTLKLFQNITYLFCISCNFIYF